MKKLIYLNIMDTEAFAFKELIILVRMCKFIVCTFSFITA